MAKPGAWGPPARGVVAEGRSIDGAGRCPWEIETECGFHDSAGSEGAGILTHGGDGLRCSVWRLRSDSLDVTG